MKKTYLFLFLIFALGTFLRFYKLDSFPVGFFRDEVSLGYNAYSILLTGKDMTGHLLPFHLESFLYSPAGYSYFSIPFIFLFDLNEFSVRFASSFFGSLTIFSTFFLTRLIFQNHKKRDFLALISSLFIAISPWHINLSRASTENILVVFFITLGVILFLLWTRKNRLYLFILGILSFSLTLYIYQAPRAFLPLFLPFLFLIFLRKSYKKWVIPLILFALLILLPVILILYSPTLSTRIRILSIFQQPATQDVLNEQLMEDGVAKEKTIVARIFNNKITDYSAVFFSNYFKHLSYDFFFTENSYPLRYRIPSMGLLYSFDILLLAVGIWSILLKDRKVGIFLLGWIILVPIGSGITFDDIPNLQRTVIFFPALSIICAYGFVQIESLLQQVRTVRKNKNLLLLINFIFIIFLLYNLGYYLQQYYIHSPLHQPWYRQVGYKELVNKVIKLSKNYSSVEITKAESNPGLFFLFYTKYNPSKIQKQLSLMDREKLNKIGFGNIPFGKYMFVNSDCPLSESTYLDSQGITKSVIKGNSNTLYVNAGSCKILRKNAKVLETIRRPDNTGAFVLYKYIP